MGTTRKRARDEAEERRLLPRAKERRQGGLEDDTNGNNDGGYAGGAGDGLDDLTAGGEVSAVAVDQKEFITKMLARYEGHYFCLRELMQNADDAGAACLTIRAFTAEGDGVTTAEGGGAAAAAVQRLEVANDGQAFTTADWQRVQTIAQGNPNEKTVGMFGVGFYSVFSLTDRPMVVSNGTAADMFYRGQQLYVCTKSSPQILERYGTETSVVLRMRQEQDFLLHELRQYLHDSIFFSRTLAYIRFVVDGEEAFTVEKARRPVLAAAAHRTPVDLLLSPFGGQCDANFRDGELALAVEEALVHRLVVSCTGLEEEEQTTAFTLVEASVAVEASEAFRAGCRAVLSKNIERHTTVQVLVQEQLHLEGAASPCGIFYVGAPTGELTGGSLHVAAHLYPTMERIKIDLTHGYLRVWNRSLMRVAGFLCKALYRWRLEVEPLTPDLALDQRQAYLADMFGFSAVSQTNGEPSAAVILAEAFFDEGRLPLLLATTCGLALAEATYLPDPGVASFLDCSSLNCFSSYRLVSPAQRRFTAFLKDKSLVLELSPADLRSELSQSVLDMDRLIAFLRWYWGICRAPLGVWKTKAERASLLKHVSFDIGHGTHRCLGDVKSYADPTLDCLPCPASSLPSSVARAFSSSTLESKGFLGLQRMDVARWLAHFLLGNGRQRSSGRRALDQATTAEPSQLALSYLESSFWAPAILSVISRHFSSLSSALNKTQVERLWRMLKASRCIPCSQRGSAEVVMAFPADATLPSEHFAAESCLFVALEISDDSGVAPVVLCDRDDDDDDAAIVDAESQATEQSTTVSRSLLKKLGVRLYPALDSYLVASEQTKRKGESSHSAMVRRLTDFAKMGADMTEEDLARVRGLPFLCCTLAGTSEEVMRCAEECYWLGKRAGQSVLDIAGLLHLPLVQLDRAEHPKLVRFLLDRLKVASTIRQADLILGAMCDTNEERTTANRCLSELFAFFSASVYKKENSAEVAFLPGEDGQLHAPATSYLVANPFGCVVAEGAQCLAEELGFDLASLGVRKEPSAEDVTRRLENTGDRLVADTGTAVAVLEYLSAREAGFSSKELKAIGKVPFLPVHTDSGLEFRRPASLLLRHLSDSNDLTGGVDMSEDVNMAEETASEEAPWEGFLPMVDLGSAAAHNFLHRCGAVYEPTAEYILRMLMADEERNAYFASRRWSSSKWLAMLHYVAQRFFRLPKALHAAMRQTPFLLAYRDNAVVAEGRISAGQPTASLVTASECFFGGCRVWAQHLNAPHVPYSASDALLSMYEKLGTLDVTVAAKQLSSAVAPYRTTARTTELQERIRSRAPLLLHSKNGRALPKLKKNAEALLRGIHVQEAAAIDVALQLGSDAPVNISACDDRFVCSVRVEGDRATLYTPAGKEPVYLEVGNQLALLTSRGCDHEERGGLYSAVLGGDLGGLEYMGFVQVSKVREEEKRAREEQHEEEEVPAHQEEKQTHSQLLRQRERIRKQAEAVMSSRTLSKFFSRSRPFQGDTVSESSHEEVRAAGEMDYMSQCATQTPLLRTSNATHAGALTLFVARARDETKVMDGGHTQECFEEFGELLVELWAVIPSSPLEMFHVYYDAATPLVAFNSNGSLFFSLAKYMEQLRAGFTKEQLLAYWFTTLCHELAHNIESAHNKNHEAAMEQLVTAFLPAISETLSRDVTSARPQRRTVVVAKLSGGGKGKGRAGRKRKGEAVVSLLSDDEDEEESRSLVGAIFGYLT